MTDHQRRALVSVLHDEVTRVSDKNQLLTFVRRWLYDHKLLIRHDRALRGQIGAALDLLEAKTGTSIVTNVTSEVLEKWRATSPRARMNCYTYPC